MTITALMCSLSATKLLHHLGRIFQENSVPPVAPVGHGVDRKLRQKIRAKKIAMGHKPDDHEDEQTQGGMTMGGCESLKNCAAKTKEKSQVAQMITFDNSWEMGWILRKSYDMVCC